MASESRKCAEANSRIHTPSPFATILFTDMVSSTALTQRLGDTSAQELLGAQRHRAQSPADRGGIEIKDTGDGIMASFFRCLQRAGVCRGDPESGGCTRGRRVGRAP